MFTEVLSFFGVELLVRVHLINLLNKIKQITGISKIKQPQVTHWIHGKVEPMGQIDSALFKKKYIIVLFALCFPGKHHFIFEFDASID